MTFWDNDAGSKIHLLANSGQDVAPIGAARQEDSLLESQMQLGSLQYPHNPMKGVGALPLPLGPCGDLRRHGAHIDIDRAGYLRHSFIAGFPTERVPKLLAAHTTLAIARHRHSTPYAAFLQATRRGQGDCCCPLPPLSASANASARNVP